MFYPELMMGDKDLEDSLSMARMAVAEEITHVLATPHYKNGLGRMEKM